MSLIQSLEWGIEIPAGNKPGLLPINKYGYDADSDAADETITTIGNITVPTAARIHAIDSSQSADIGDAQIYGVDGSYNYVSAGEPVDVNGTTGNNTTVSYLDIFRMRYKGHSGATNVGNIFAIAAVDGTETARIPGAAGQTQRAMMLIPDTVDGVQVNGAYMTNFKGAFSKIAGVPEVKVQLWVFPFGECWQAKEALTLSTENKSDEHWYSPSRAIAPKSWVKLTANSTVANQEIWGSFDIVIDYRV